MYRRTVVVALASTTVAVLAGSTADESGERIGETPATGGGDRSNGDGRTGERADRTAESAGPGAEGADVAFELAPYEISECGLACREATTTVTNVGSDDATDVRVLVTLFADGKPIWETDEAVGRLPAGASVTRTKRVEVGVGEAMAIEDGGNVTAETIIDSDQRTARIVRETEL
ncbi:hypothetical protein [Halosolutus gelatinilyticus]|uniref:hypothetical protein n=1 Tax=Halosolutus gelatinilyticus TaxID=2931975 RepID=UPI001FF41DBA|nr:hypothetical protein [Halosolutus gelatinilyticus]